MKQFWKKLKEFGWGYLLIALIFCASGLLFFVYPDQSAKTLAYIIAGCCTLCGLLQVVNILARKKRGFSFALQIIGTSLTLICGLIAFIIPETIATYYPMFLGLFIIVDGSFKLQTVISAKRYQLKAWWFLLIFAVITIALGFLVVRIQPEVEKLESFFRLLGSALFVSGIQNLFTPFFAGVLERKQKEEVVSDLKAQEPFTRQNIESNVIENTTEQTEKNA